MTDARFGWRPRKRHSVDHGGSAPSRSFVRVLVVVAMLLGSLALSTGGASASSPTVNGLFFGDGDDSRYVLYNSSLNDSGLYFFVDSNSILYVALVVSPTTNDVSFAPGPPTLDYSTNAGFSRHRSARALADSEFAEFDLSCGTHNWNWNMGLGTQPVQDWRLGNWSVNLQAGTPPPNVAQATSHVWNMNNYAARFNNGDPLAWSMSEPGDETDNRRWWSPRTFTGAGPIGTEPVGLDGYPSAAGPLGYSSVYEWEWPMVYEWSVDLADPAVCDGESVFFISGSSHHSPAKAGSIGGEDDNFPPPPGGGTLRDFGDAPATYGDADHQIVINGVHLGAVAPDPEPTSQYSPDATGDDAAGSNDEDGLVVNGGAGLNPAGGLTTLRIEVNGTPDGGWANGAWLNGWLDFGNDGTFGVGESIFASGVFVSATTVSGVGTLGADGSLSGPGVFDVVVDLPSFEGAAFVDPLTGYPTDWFVISRLRIASVSAEVAGPVGTASDGEIEDHAIPIAYRDLGDAPASYGDAAHVLTDGGVHLGTNPGDHDPSTNYSPLADGDDDSRTNDEDGVVINGGAGLAGGTTATITIEVNGTPDGDWANGAWLNGWLDFDNDGTFGVGESIFAPGVFVSATTSAGTGTLGPDGSVSGPGVYTVTINVPNLDENGSGYAIGDSVVTRFRIASDTDDVAEPTGTATDGEVEDHVAGINALPVDLAAFSSTANGRATVVSWRTAQEVDNLGFRVHAGDDPDALVLLTRDVVASAAPTSSSSQAYSVRITTDATTLWLESIDLDGTVHLHGPFARGTTWGDPNPPPAIDWEAAEQAVRAATPPAPAVDARPSTTGLVAEIEVREPALYRLTAADLAAAGVDLTGVPTAHLALTLAGDPVPVRITGRGGRFGDQHAVEFWGEPIDSLYSDSTVYQVHVDRSLARRIGIERTPVPGRAKTTVHDALVELEQQRSYSVLAPGDDPWFDQLLVARPGRPRTVTRTLELSRPVTGSGDAVVSVDLWGLSRSPVPDDHRVTVAVNGTVVLDDRFDGAEAPTLSAVVAANLLRDGANDVAITSYAVDGVALDMVALDSVSLEHVREARVDGDALRLRNTDEFVEVRGVASTDVTVLRLDGDDVTWVRRSVARVDRTDPTGYQVVVPPADDLVVVPASAVRTPDVRPARPTVDLTGGGADYLVVAHPSLVGAAGPLVAFHEAQGRSVRVVDVFDVYQAYGHGMVDAAAIDAYLADAVPALGARWVLLAGADTYDYLDYGGTGAFSLLPSPYGAVGVGGVRHAPIDPAYADLDGDGVPDVALGRLPARTPDELAAMVDKTIDYAAVVADAAPSALLVADDAAGLDLTAVSDDLAGRLAGWSVTTADIGAQGLTEARASLLEGLAAGPALTSYIGHSGVREWGRAGFFTTRDVSGVTGASRPTAIVQYGCWNTYYVQPGADTLAHQLLLAPEGGAATVMGGVTLTSSYADVAFAELATERFAAGNGTYGEAVLGAKQALAQSHPGLAEIQLGWTVLGDPALPLPGGQR